MRLSFLRPLLQKQGACRGEGEGVGRERRVGKETERGVQTRTGGSTQGTGRSGACGRATGSLSGWGSRHLPWEVLPVSLASLYAYMCFPHLILTLTPPGRTHYPRLTDRS